MTSTAPQSFAAALQQPPSPPADPDAALRKKTAVLHVRYEDDRGQLFEGDFTNTILTISQRIAVDVARAQMSGGIDPDVMSRRAFGLLFAICWMKVSITAGPDWIKALAESTEEDLVEAIWEQVSRHEDRFFGRKKQQS